MAAGPRDASRSQPCSHSSSARRFGDAGQRIGMRASSMICAWVDMRSTFAAQEHYERQQHQHNEMRDDRVDEEARHAGIAELHGIHRREPQPGAARGRCCPW